MAYEQKCVICDEAITNPICPECLEREIMCWIGEIKPSLIPILMNVGDAVKSYTHDNTSCAICSETMNVCPHCYCFEIFSWLNENGYKQIGLKFLDQFNYELDYRFDVKTARQMAEQQEIG